MSLRDKLKRKKPLISSTNFGNSDKQKSSLKDRLRGRVDTTRENRGVNAPTDLLTLKNKVREAIDLGESELSETELKKLSKLETVLKLSEMGSASEEQLSELLDLVSKVVNEFKKKQSQNEELTQIVSELNDEITKLNSKYFSVGVENKKLLKTISDLQKQIDEVREYRPERIIEKRTEVIKPTVKSEVKVIKELPKEFSEKIKKLEEELEEIKKTPRQIGGGYKTGTTAHTVAAGDHNHSGTYLATASFSGLAKITVGTTEPTSPSTGDLWIDTN